jgi:cytidylate kinase
MAPMGTEPVAPVVTISATYGTGGSRIGRRVAEVLGLPFVDRAIPGAVAEKLGLSPHEAEAHDEVGPRGLERLMWSLASVGPVSGIDFRADFPERSFCEATEAAIRRHADEGGGVILGRAAAVVLADRPATLHVRLDGPVARRVRHAMGLEGIDEATAGRRLRDNDAARAAYVRTFYGVDAADPALYHLAADPTVLDLEACVDVIARAARARTGEARLPLDAS